MKLFRTKYDLTLNEVSLMFETGNTKILCTRRWIPGLLLKRYYARFMVEFTELFNKEEVSELFTDDIYRLRIINRAQNLIPSLYYGLVMTEDLRFRDMYRDLYGKEFAGAESLKAMVEEIKRLGGKLKELGTPAERTQGKASMTFEQVITYVEMVLERSLDREMKLYQFKYQYDLAVRRAREYERSKLKDNG